MITHIILLVRKTIARMLYLVRSWVEIGGKLCWDDYIAFKGVVWSKLWHFDYVSRQLLQYKHNITRLYYSQGWDVIIPMVMVHGGLLCILIVVYKGKLDDICILEWPWGDKILCVPTMEKLLLLMGMSLNTGKVVLLLTSSLVILWLFPGGWRWVLLGLWVKMIRTLYLNIQLGVHVIFNAPWLDIRVIRYWHEHEMVQFITQVINNYKVHTGQPELQVNIDKLLTQLLNAPVVQYDELQIIQHIATYLHIYYPKPVPLSWGETVLEYLFLHHPLLGITVITVTMLTVICVVHNRPRPDLEIYHWRKPWDWEWEWPWETVDWYDLPDGKNFADYTEEQLAQYRAPRPSREALLKGWVPGEGVRRARWWQYWKWDMFKYHNISRYRWYQYYEQLEEWWERKRNRGGQN